MEQFVGLDVSQAETGICVVDAAGAVQWQGKCASTPEAISGDVEAESSASGPHSFGNRTPVRLALAGSE